MDTQLTIAIPTYNGGLTIRETLDSILAQYQEGLEIVISDNASTDNTKEIIHEYKNIYPFLKYYGNSHNLGMDRNFDLAIRRSMGKFVWLFSDDDVLVNGAVHHALSVLAKFESLGHIFVNYGIFDENLNLSTKERALPVFVDSYYENGEEYLNEIAIGPIFLPSNIFRRSLWENSNNASSIGTDWIHYATLLESMNHATGYCVAYPYIRLRSRAVWTANGQLYLHTISLVEIIRNHSPPAFNRWTVDVLIGKVTKNLFLTLLSSKRDGLKFNISLVRNSIRQFYKSPSFWFFAFPIIFLPNSLIRIIWRVRNHFRGLVSNKNHITVVPRD